MGMPLTDLTRPLPSYKLPTALHDRVWKHKPRHHDPAPQEAATQAAQKAKRASTGSPLVQLAEHEVELAEALDALRALHGSAEQCHQQVTLQVERMAAELVDAVHRRRDELLEACEAFAKGDAAGLAHAEEAID